MRLIPAIACLAVLAVSASWAGGQAASAKQGATVKGTLDKSAVGKETAGPKYDAHGKGTHNGATGKDTAKVAAPKGLLPDAFAGWVADVPAKKLTDAAAADAENCRSA